MYGVKELNITDMRNWFQDGQLIFRWNSNDIFLAHGRIRLVGAFYGRIRLAGVRFLAGLDSLFGLWQHYTCRCFYGRIRLVRVRDSQDSKHA